MATQTGSIDLTASNSVKLMAEAGFESVEQTYATKGELEVTNEQVALRATKTEVTQMAQPNLSPFFSMAPTNVYNATTNPDGYWDTNKASGWTLEQLADGWAHIDFSNTGTSTRWLTIYEHCVWRHQAGDLKGSTKYTVMFEFRNVTKTGKVTCIGMTQVSTSWPSMFIGNSEQGNVAVADGVQYHVGTTVADPASVTGNACSTRTLISFPAGSSLDAEFRVSLYEGEYTGPYKPYSGGMMYASNSELKVTAEGINTEVSKKVGNDEIISKINQSAETVKIQASKVEIDGTAIFSAISSDVDDAITDKGYQTASQVNTAITSKGYATTTQAQGYANGAYEKIRSQGIQLVTNGNGYLGDNTNWPTLTFDGVKSNASPGAFTRTVGPTTIMSDEYFPIDASKDYLFEFDAMSIDGSARFYSFLAMCDVDKNIITAQPVMYYENTLTTLANDLNPGDTTVRLTSATNWASTTDGHQRSLIFWDYTNSFGYTYPEESYSRNYYADIYANDDAVDKSTGVITLKAPWSGPKKLAGTKVSQNHSGDQQVYAQVNKYAPTEWEHFSFVYSGLDLIKNGADSTGKFRQGTAFAKVGFLWNYGHSTANPQTQMWVTNISVKEATPDLSDAVSRTQRIWYRKSAVGTPATPGTASSNWVTKADDGSNAWTKMHVAISSTHKYIYTCEQYEMADGTVGYTSVLLDNTITVIDGGSIITNSVTANKLNASNINASKSLTVGAMTDTAAATILNSNVQVGGRNLLIGSSTGAGWSYSTFDKNSVTYTRSTTETRESFVTGPLTTFEAGETYTLSCWAKSNGNVTSMDMFKVHSSGGGSHQSHSFSLTTEYQKLVWTFTCNATSDEVARIRFDNNGSKASGTEAILYVKEPKLEKGNKATDWTPAPEDVDAAVSDAAKTATNYITAEADGIKIHMVGESTTYQHQTATDTTFYITGKKRTKVGSDGLHIYVDTDESEIASFTSSGAVVGKTASSHFAQDATTATFYGTNGTDKNLSIETDNGVGIVKFNGDRSSISGFANMLGLRSYGSSDSSDNGMVTITAESEDVNTASGTIGQTYLWMYSDQSNAHAELESVDGNGGMAGVLVDGKNSEVDITGDLKLVNSTLAPSYGGTGKTSLQATRSAMGLGNTTGALPVANGGTGKTTAAAARVALGAAARSWTSLDTSTNDTAMTYDLSNYYEVMFIARAGTDYVGSVVLPKAQLSTTAREVYLSGGSNSSTGGRGFAVTATSTKATPAARKVDGTTTSCTWWTYAR